MENRTIVVKLGTSVLTGDLPASAVPTWSSWSDNVPPCIDTGTRVVLVTSRAIAAGREHLGHPPLAPTLPNKQMLAAVGQPSSSGYGRTCFNLYGLHRPDAADRADLGKTGALPQYPRHPAHSARSPHHPRHQQERRRMPPDQGGDSGSAHCRHPGGCGHWSCSRIRGLFTADPRPDAQLIEGVQTIDDTLRSLAGDSVSGLGTGVATKLQAADVARRAGVDVVIATGPGSRK